MQMATDGSEIIIPSQEFYFYDTINILIQERQIAFCVRAFPNLLLV